MSGVSFKIQAPPRPSAVRNGSGSGSAPPRRRDDAESPRASGSATPARSQSRSASIRADESDSDAEGDSGARDAASRRKRAKLLGEGDEEVVEFGPDGARSKHAKAPTGPLVIAALPNKDWRKAAEELRAGRNPIPGRRKKELYIPEGASAGAMRMQSLPGSASSTASPAAGVDAINTEEVVGGLSARPAMPASGPTEEAVERVRQEIDTVEVATPPGSVPPESAPAVAPAPAALTDEQRALRELLGHDATAGETEQIPEAIYSAPDDRGKPIDETEAFKRDVDTRPDEASLDDYARVPVGQFGMAMLRGMGWQPGQAASRSGRGAIEAHVPSSRPSLLGIGAKPMAEQLDTGTDAKGGKAGGGMPPRRNTKREDMRFMPLMKRERTDEGGSRGGSSEPSRRYLDSTSSSRRPSASPPPPSTSTSSRHASRRASPSRRDSDREDRDRDRRRRDYGGDSRRSRDDRDRDRDRERDRDRGSSRRDRDRDERPSRSDRDRERFHSSAPSGSASSRRPRGDEDRERSYRSRDDERDAYGGSSRLDRDRSDRRSRD